MKTRSSRLIKFQLKPDDPGIWDHRGLKELRQYEAALASFDKAVQIARKLQSLAQPGFDVKKLKLYEDALLEKPFSSSPIIMKLGLIEVLCFCCKEAFTSLTEPSNSNLMTTLKLPCPEELGRYEDAIASFDQAIHLKPNSPKPGINAVMHSSRWVAIHKRSPASIKL